MEQITEHQALVTYPVEIFISSCSCLKIFFRFFLIHATKELAKSDTRTQHRQCGGKATPIVDVLKTSSFW